LIEALDVILSIAVLCTLLSHEVQPIESVYFQAEMNALHQQEQELLAGKEQIVDVLSRIEEEKVL
jgi:hypothetical protein